MIEVESFPWKFRLDGNRVSVYDALNHHIGYLGSVEFYDDGTFRQNVHHANPTGKLPLADCMEVYDKYSKGLEV